MAISLAPLERLRIAVVEPLVKRSMLRSDGLGREIVEFTDVRASDLRWLLAEFDRLRAFEPLATPEPEDEVL